MTYFLCFFLVPVLLSAFFFTISLIFFHNPVIVFSPNFQFFSHFFFVLFRFYCIFTFHSWRWCFSYFCSFHLCNDEFIQYVILSTFLFLVLPKQIQCALVISYFKVLLFFFVLFFKNLVCSRNGEKRFFFNIFTKSEFYLYYGAYSICLIFHITISLWKKIITCKWTDFQTIKNTIFFHAVTHMKKKVTNVNKNIFIQIMMQPHVHCIFAIINIHSLGFFVNFSLCMSNIAKIHINNPCICFSFFFVSLYSKYTNLCAILLDSPSHAESILNVGECWKTKNGFYSVCKVFSVQANDKNITLYK